MEIVAKKRKMKLTVLEESSGEDRSPYRFLAAVSGFGAYLILSAEAGFHVLELPGDGQTPQRAKIRVQVVPQSEAPDGAGDKDWYREAQTAFEKDQEQMPAIVRRYRERPSPLVRDSLKGWRTGHIDKVLDGDFDLFSFGSGGSPTKA